MIRVVDGKAIWDRSLSGLLDAWVGQPDARSGRIIDPDQGEELLRIVADRGNAYIYTYIEEPN